MFGIKIVTKKGLKRIEQNARNQAIVELIALLRCKDKIYLEPVTLVGNGQTIRDCVFLGTDKEMRKRMDEAYEHASLMMIEAVHLRQQVTELEEKK